MYYHPYTPYHGYYSYRLNSTDELNEGLYKWGKFTFSNDAEKEAFIFYLDKESGDAYILSFPALTTSRVNVSDIKSFKVMEKPPKAEGEGQNGGGQEEQEQQQGSLEGGQNGGQGGSGGQNGGSEGQNGGSGGGQNGGSGGQGGQGGQNGGTGGQNGGSGGGQSPFGEMPG
ncbi:hypothetical protein SLL00_10425, partial [Metabacillus indicus]|uniref:hypothetical protein n=1 Tax=Metabacillus indicus TaxID=246786 RepID=UPI002A007A4F